MILNFLDSVDENEYYSQRACACPNAAFIIMYGKRLHV